MRALTERGIRSNESGLCPRVGGVNLSVNYIQGEAMGRPSKIKSTLNIEGDRCGIKVGGNAVVLAEGDIHI